MIGDGMEVISDGQLDGDTFVKNKRFAEVRVTSKQSITMTRDWSIKKICNLFVIQSVQPARRLKGGWRSMI